MTDEIANTYRARDAAGIETIGALTPTGAAKMLVTIYGHPNWKPTGIEEMALLVARTFLAQQPDPRETIPHYGSGPQEVRND